MQILRKLRLCMHVMGKSDKNITLDANTEKMITLHTVFGQIRFYCQI